MNDDEVEMSKVHIDMYKSREHLAIELDESELGGEITASKVVPVKSNEIVSQKLLQSIIPPPLSNCK